MSNALPNPQYKTSAIISNESLMGFQDAFEFAGRVSHMYEELLTSVGGMPTNGSVSIRQIGYPQLQYGLVETVSEVSQQFETIQVNTDDMVGNTYTIDPVTLMASRNKITDTTHYQTCQQIGSSINLNCYERLVLGANLSIGDATSSTVDASLLVDINTMQDSFNIPSATTCLFLSTKAYASLAKNILALNTFDEELNKTNVSFKVNTYMGQPLVRSSALAGVSMVSFYPTGKNLTFAALTSTDSYKSCVISLAGATAGDELLPGDRLNFTVTQRINRSTKAPLAYPLQLVVQNSVTAGAGGIFSGVICTAGILDINTDPWFANVQAIPEVGEVVRLVGSYDINFATVKPGFTFATLSLPAMQTLDVGEWCSGKKIYSVEPGVRRNQETAAAPLQIYTCFDADVLQRGFYMRIDTQPVYKAFVDYNIAILTLYTGPTLAELRAKGQPTPLERIKAAREKKASPEQRIQLLQKDNIVLQTKFDELLGKVSGMGAMSAGSDALKAAQERNALLEKELKVFSDRMAALESLKSGK